MFESEKYKQTWADIKQYAATRFDLFKVGFLEKAARIVGLILFALVMVLLLFAVISFGCIALIFALGQVMPMWASTLIVVALWIAMMIGAVVFRNRLFINPILAAISAILFEVPEAKTPAQSNPSGTQPQASAPSTAEKEVSHE